MCVCVCVCVCLVSVTTDLPIGNLFSNHPGDESRLHPFLNKLAEGVVCIGSIQHNVGDVIEHTDETLEKNKKKTPGYQPHQSQKTLQPPSPHSTLHATTVHNTMGP